MINRIFLLGRLGGWPIPQPPAEASESGGELHSLLLPLTTFAPRLTFEGDLLHDRQSLDVNVVGRVAELAELVLEPGQLLWVDARLGSDSAVGESTPPTELSPASERATCGLRIVATWFTILASAEASRHLDGMADIASNLPSSWPARKGRAEGFGAESGTPRGAVGGAP